MSEHPYPHPQGVDPSRRELHIVRVANGWLIQPAAFAMNTDAEGNPLPPNTPDKLHVARTVGGLLASVQAWADPNYAKRPAPLDPQAERSPSWQD